MFANFIKNFWDKSFMGITVGHVIMAVIVFVVVFIVGKIVLYFALKFIKRLFAKHVNFDEKLHKALKQPLNFLVLVIAFYFFADLLEPSGAIKTVIDKIIRSLMVLCFFWFIINIIAPFTFVFKKLEERLSKAIIEWLVRLIKVLLAFTAIASILQIWGIQIGPIIAGLGLFSVALALGAQDLFKNLIAGIVILAEKRFSLGERIVAAGVDGIVEHIGFRSTRIRTLDEIPIFVPNATFSDQALTNLSGQNNRPISWTLGLVYGTSAKQLQAIVDDMRAYIKAAPDLVYDDDVVYVSGFGDSAINITVKVFVISAEYTQMMRSQQKLAFKVMELVEANGSDFAFPSRSLYVEKLPPGSTAFPFAPRNDDKPKTVKDDTAVTTDSQAAENHKAKDAAKHAAAGDDKAKTHKESNAPPAHKAKPGDNA